MRASLAAGVAVAALLAAAPGLARAQAATSADMQQLRAELKALQEEEAAAKAAEQARERRIEALARQLGADTQAPRPPKPVETLPAAAATAENPANIEIYGFAQADFIQDFNRVNPNWDSALRPSRIPTTKGLYGSDGQTVVSVKQSRFGIKGSQEVGGRTLTGKFEFDLYGTGVDQGQTTMRLRHFYGTWGPLLFGQTNSNWMDIDTFPNVIDYWGPNGMVFIRTPQIRLTWKGGKNELAVAVEHVTNDIDPGNIRTLDPGLGSSITNDEKLPDLTAHYRYDDNWGHAQIAGILRRVGYDTPGTPDNRPKGEETGWGVNLSASINTWRKDKLQLSMVYGEGIASYLNDGGMDLGPHARVVPPPAGTTIPPALVLSPDAVPLLGLMFYYDHYWNDHFSTSLGYSQTRVENVNFQSGDAYRLGQYVSANLLWTPTPSLMFGAEYLWGERTDKNGANGDDNRIQFSFKYSFTTGDLLR